MKHQSPNRRSFLASVAAGTVAVTTAGGCSGSRSAVGAPQTLDYVPSTISPEAQAVTADVVCREGRTMSQQDNFDYANP